MKILLNITESKPCSIHKGWPSTEDQNGKTGLRKERSLNIGGAGGPGSLKKKKVAQNLGGIAL